MSKPKILAVDDQPENLRLIVEMLKSDYSVIACTSSEKACDLALKEPHPAAILLDVFMPGIDGFELLEQMREHHALAEIPVLFVTGDNAEQGYAKGLELGAFDFVTKPISPALLKNRLKNCLS